MRATRRAARLGPARNATNPSGLSSTLQKSVARAGAAAPNQQSTAPAASALELRMTATFLALPACFQPCSLRPVRADCIARFDFAIVVAATLGDRRSTAKIQLLGDLTHSEAPARMAYPRL